MAVIGDYFVQVHRRRVKQWGPFDKEFDDEEKLTTTLDCSVPRGHTDPPHPRSMHNIVDKKHVRRAGHRMPGELWRQGLATAIDSPMSCDIFKHIG